MDARLPGYDEIARTLLREIRYRTLPAVRRYWFSTALLALGTYAVQRKNLSIDVSWNAGLMEKTFSKIPVSMPAAEKVELSLREDPPLNVSLLPGFRKASQIAEAPPRHDAVSEAAMTAEELAKRKAQEAYVRRYAAIAQVEMEKYGIPASITLAQGILETNAGSSPLVKTANNHFGIKCFSRTCRRGHCRNFSDDSHKDFFRIYPNAWESYRAHSLLLQAPRYQKLYKYAKSDYKNWAHGLKKAGYATDPRYAEKLIRHIEELKLHRYDQ